MVERDSRQSSPEEGELEKDEFTPPPSSLRHRDNPTSAKSHQDGDRSIERSRRRAGLDPYDDERPGVVLPRKRPRDQYDSPSDLPKPHKTLNDSENRANPSEHSPKRKMQPHRPHSPLARAIPSSPRRSPARPSPSVQNGEAPHPAAATTSLHEGVPSIAAKDEPLTEEELARMEWPPLSEDFASRLAEAWSKEMDICRGAVFNHGESAVARRADGRKLHKSTNVRKWLGCSSIDSYDVSVQLGEGTFGVVLKGKHRITGQDVAMKKITVHDAKDGLALTTIREIKLLKELRHSAIVPVIDMVYRPAAPGQAGQGDIFMVEPYMDHDLAGLLDSVTLSLPQIKLYIKQLFSGTEYLHRNHILHRDIKSANLLINNKGQLQIADFGLARSFRNMDFAPGHEAEKYEYTGTVVTRWYRPPELLAGLRQYGPAIDMWGLGCILIEMFYKKPFFKGTSEINQLELISKQCGSPNEDNFPGWNKLAGVRNADAQGRVDESKTDGQRHFGFFPRILFDTLTKGPVTVPVGAADLADKLLALDPAKRLTADEALDHEWLWTAPFPSDPNCLPKYEPRKESDRKKREQQVPRQAADQQWASHSEATRFHSQNGYPAPSAGVPQPLAGGPYMARPPLYAPVRPTMPLRGPVAGQASGGNVLSKLKF